MKDKWLHDLRDRMSEFEMDSPEGLWEDIKRAECARQARRVMPWRLWLKRAAAVAAVGVIMILTVGRWGESATELSLHVANSVSVVEHGVETSDIVVAEQAVELSCPVMTKKQLMQAEAVPVPVDETVDIVEDEVTKIAAEDAEDDVMMTDTVTRLHLPDNCGGSLGSRPIIASAGGRGSRLSVGVYSSGGVNSNFKQRGMGNDVMSAGYEGTGWEDSPMLGILLYNQGKEINTKITHRQPVRAGVSLTYMFNDRLGVVTGLSYANLTSDITNGSDTHYFTGQQTLHYIGIPVSVTYDVLRWRRLLLYASAGVLGEKCVYGNRVTDYVIDGNSMFTEKEMVEKKPLQFSVNASAGVQFDITDAVGVYAEPGVSYYFNDGTQIRTIYKDKPLNFNLNLGVRFTLGR